ncbi:META domain-containing protein [Methanofollis fontis]|nr:META domain-containing protein [Methanofollis fontis]
MNLKAYGAVALLLVCSIFAGGCSSGGGGDGTPTTTPATGVPLTGTTWDLVLYADGSGGMSSPIAGTAIRAAFGEDGQVSGSAGCNNYFASYEAGESSLSIGPIASTERFCADPAGVMEQEAAYLALLGSAAGYTADDGRLEVTDASGRTILTFTGVVPAPLRGTAWTLSAYNDEKGGMLSLLAGTEITAVFESGGQMSGSAGCNDYFASYEADAGSLRIGPVGTTRMACADPAGVMDQETAYLGLLPEVSAYAITGDVLALSDGAGRTLLEYRVIPAVPLSGTSWTLTAYRSAAGELVAPIDGTNVTAVFGDDGEIGGSAGCNLYSGPYRAEGSMIEIGPLAVTAMFCAEPAGVQEQEDTVLAHLGAAGGYRIEGAALVLTDTPGTTLLEFAAA